MFKRTKHLSSNTTLRGDAPAGNSRNWINMKIDAGNEAMKPKRLGCADQGWEKTGGVTSVRPVDKV